MIHITNSFHNHILNINKNFVTLFLTATTLTSINRPFNNTVRHSVHPSIQERPVSGWPVFGACRWQNGEWSATPLQSNADATCRVPPPIKATGRRWPFMSTLKLIHAANIANSEADTTSLYTWYTLILKLPERL